MQMAKAKKTEPKIELEREYIVPLRKGWLKVPEYKRANKAVKTLKEFIAQHMKVYDRDLRKIKVEKDLNNEIRFKGMRKPPARIKVKAIKYDNGIVRVELVDIPIKIKFKRLIEEKKKLKLEKKVKKPEEPGDKEGAKTLASEEEIEETKEKEAASKEESLELAKQQAKQEKHTSKPQQVEKQVHRKALSR